MAQYREAFLSDAALQMSKARLALSGLMKDPADANDLFEIMRLFHSVKGSAAMMQKDIIQKACAGEEERYKKIRESGGKATADTVAETLRVIDGIEGELQKEKAGG